MLVFVNHDDMRSLEVIEEMIQRGHYVSDQLKDMRYADVIYLGGKGIDRKNRMNYQQETVVFSDEMFSSLKENSLILTLIHNDYLEELSAQHHFRYAALLDDEEFVEKNSILTAEGLMSYLIQHRRYPLYKSRITILGYGHCAKPIIRCLKAFQADVEVAVRHGKYQREIEKEGCRYIDIQDVNLKDVDILINTVPSIVVSEEKLDKANPRIMIVDIASYPYGLNHHYALFKGLNSQILPSIPSKYAYGYAGKMIADEMERMINDV